MRKPRPWTETREVLRRVAEKSDDRDIAQALDVIAGLEELLAAHAAARAEGLFDGSAAMSRLERAGYR